MKNRHTPALLYKVGYSLHGHVFLVFIIDLKVSLFLSIMFIHVCIGFNVMKTSKKKQKIIQLCDFNGCLQDTMVYKTIIWPYIVKSLHGTVVKSLALSSKVTSSILGFSSRSDCNSKTLFDQSPIINTFGKITCLL